MKIKVIMPDKAMDRKTLDEREVMLSKALSPGVGISVDCIKRGPDELDCNTDEAFAAAELVKESIQAEKDGFDAIVIYCFSDVGIDAVRENVRIPVIGPGETALSAANMLCNRFTVITTERINIPRTYRRLMRNGIAREKMTSVRALDIPIMELRSDPGITGKYLKNVCADAVDKEQVDGVILGCLGMASYGDMIEEELPVKVFDPAFISVAYAEMCARLGMRHNPAVYPPFMNNSNVEL
ncbi:allantoin racemase [Dethiosulfatibacter aminovorans DSM 17477]|uniref:Allantoin racemase n=1 Tax=Dethiosulfatibacter aminovorans DSM 17477 TaxID=1121476 RepID=A0A1M6APM5_9FIRM|nr:aspartate/glutamate racemase family protein [Dethiosulfatibacter aminovorans]SHI38415.1 allantoin racemase [Dethiosulfatibacter aminovorans DSM 17477]